MNRARVAALLRELAEEFERDEQLEAVPVEAKSKPRKRRAHVRIVPPPLGEPSPIDRAAARKLLRRQGLA